MKKLIMVAITLLAFSSCLKEAEKTEQTTNKNFNLELLFNKDGCNIYRFTDAGHQVYWTNCSGKLESVYQQSNGKSSHEKRIQNQTSIN